MENTKVHDDLHTEVMENVIHIQMLGGFNMTYRGQPVLLGKSLSSKMLHLLMLLIYSRGEGIRRTVCWNSFTETAIPSRLPIL